MECYTHIYKMLCYVSLAIAPWETRAREFCEMQSELLHTAFLRHFLGRGVLEISLFPKNRLKKTTTLLLERNAKTEDRNQRSRSVTA